MGPIFYLHFCKPYPCLLFGICSLKKSYSCIAFDMHAQNICILRMYAACRHYYKWYFSFVFLLLQNGETPLKLAVDKMYKEVVYYLTQEVKQDISNFSQVISIKIYVNIKLFTVFVYTF